MSTIRRLRAGSVVSSQQGLLPLAMSTSAASGTSSPAISPATGSATSSPASEDGRPHSGLPVGPTIARAGPDRRLASLSARQAAEQGLLTSGTYGRHGFMRSASADRQFSLSNKLRQRLQGRGSIALSMTWKERLLPSRRLVSRLVAWARRTSGNEFMPWPSPSARDWKGLPSEQMDGARPLNEVVASVAPWISPQAADENGSGLRQHTSSLCQQVRTSGPAVNGFPVGMDGAGSLNPAFSLWLQGLPIEWVLAAPSRVGREE